MYTLEKQHQQYQLCVNLSSLSLCVYIYIYIYKTNANFKCVTSNIWIRRTQNLLKSQIFLFFSEALSMCNQITSKNISNSVTSKEDHQKNKLSKQYSKFPSKRLVQSQCLYCQLWTMFSHAICLNFKNIWYIQNEI